MIQKTSIIIGALFSFAAFLSPHMAFAAETKSAARMEIEEEEKPYFFKDEKVDFGTYNGFRRYHSECHVCHGPDANGSSFAPALRISMQDITYDDFLEVVVNGRTTNIGGVLKVMPPLGENNNVMLHIDDLYAYLRARADGALKPGRPPHLPKVKE